MSTSSSISGAWRGVGDDLAERHLVEPALPAVGAEDEPVRAGALDQLDLVALVELADLGRAELVRCVEQADDAIADRSAARARRPGRRRRLSKLSRWVDRDGARRIGLARLEERRPAPAGIPASRSSGAGTAAAHDAVDGIAARRPRRGRERRSPGATSSGAGGSSSRRFLPKIAKANAIVIAVVVPTSIGSVADRPAADRPRAARGRSRGCPSRAPPVRRCRRRSPDRPAARPVGRSNRRRSCRHRRSARRPCRAAAGDRIGGMAPEPSPGRRSSAVAPPGRGRRPVGAAGARRPRPPGPVGPPGRAGAGPGPIRPVAAPVPRRAGAGVGPARAGGRSRVVGGRLGGRGRRRGRVGRRAGRRLRGRGRRGSGSGRRRLRGRLGGRLGRGRGVGVGGGDRDRDLPPSIVSLNCRVSAASKQMAWVPTGSVVDQCGDALLPVVLPSPVIPWTPSTITTSRGRRASPRDCGS